MTVAALLEGRDQIAWKKRQILMIHASSLRQMMSRTQKARTQKSWTQKAQTNNVQEHKVEYVIAKAQNPSTPCRLQQIIRF